MTEIYALNLRYLIAALPVFLGISLMSASPGVRHTLQRMADLFAVYFFSFSPAALLCYLLYKIHLLQ